MRSRPTHTLAADGARPNWCDATQAFYEEHASEYARATLDLPMAPALRGLVLRLKPGDGIVDLGCGAGRDLKTYCQYHLTGAGLDYSHALCVLARRHSGAPVVVGDMRQLPFAGEAFRGASATASLLHLDRHDITVALAEIRRVLKPNGLLFTSMKRGLGEQRDRFGRWFSFFEPDEWINQLHSAGFAQIESSTNYEHRENGFSTEQISWINCLSMKS